jgi:transposase
VTSESVNLPEDSEALKAIVRSLVLERDRETQRAEQQQLRAEQQQLRAEQLHRSAEEHQRFAEESKRQVEQLRVEKLRLELELERFRKWYYGPRADRLRSAGDVAQMLLAFAEELDRKPVHPDDAPPATAPAEPRRMRRHTGRRNLADSENLPFTTHVHELSAEERACPCCGAQRQEMGEEESWQVEYYPGHFERIQHLRKKYACRGCESKGAGPSIETAAKPEAAIEKGMAGPGLLSYIVTSKFADYLPLYRLEDIFQRQGFEISRATQSIWCGDVADLVEPLYELMAARVRASHVVATDDTIMPMLAKGKTANARMWVYVGDEAGPYNIFDFTLNRGRDGPKYFLKDYRNVLLADAYGGYNGVVAGNQMTRAGCWAHARRRMVEAEKTAPEIAREAVELVRALYAVEHRGKNLSAAARLELRQAETAPVLDGLKKKILAWKQQLLPKHPMAEALNYALGQWDELTVFCSDGAVPIDNNVSEREMKRVVLNRKNSLFVGNARGGRTAAILASLTSSCRRHDMDPQRYLTQLLVNLPAARLSDLPAWLPDEWKRRQTAPPDSPISA